MENSTLEPSNTMHKFTVGDIQAGQRLDLYLKTLFPTYSRNFFQQLIHHKMVLVNNENKLKPKTIVKAKDQVVITFPQKNVDRSQVDIPNDMNIQVIHKNKDFIIINKPHNVSVHPPSITNKKATLTDWLVNKFNEISLVGYLDRPGIVHRLDKDTSGIMIIACNNFSHATLCDLFKNRQIEKTYLAIVNGHPEKEGTIDVPIRRNPKKRTTMTHVLSNQEKNESKFRDACTNYKVLEYFKDCSLVEVKPITGRTHQIRVHFTALGYPLFGDCIYGRKSKLISRQALHAHKLSFKFNGKQHDFCQNPPADFQKIIEILRNN